MEPKKIIEPYLTNPTFHKLAGMIYDIEYSGVLTKKEIAHAVEFGLRLSDTKRVQNADLLETQRNEK